MIAAAWLAFLVAAGAPALVAIVLHNYGLIGSVYLLAAWWPWESKL